MEHQKALDILENYEDDLKNIKGLSELYELSAKLSLAVKTIHPDIACKSGCNFCCIKAGDVFVTPMEWELINDFINKVDEQLKNVIKAQVKEIWFNFVSKITPGVNTLNIIKSTRCAFLINGGCSIYPVRPLVCRNLGVTKRFSKNIADFFVPHTCEFEKPRWVKFSQKENTLELNLPVAEYIYDKLIELNGEDYSLQHILLKAKEYFE